VEFPEWFTTGAILMYAGQAATMLPAYNVPYPRPKGPETVYLKALRVEENPATKPCSTGSL
jgi:hypothetical protein